MKTISFFQSTLLIGAPILVAMAACQGPNDEKPEPARGSVYQAQVFAIDPIATPEPMLVELSWLDSPSLTSEIDEQGIPKIAVYSCMDRGETSPGMDGIQKICTLEQRANAATNESFVYDDWEKTITGRYDDQDIHAEVSAYYHTQKIYQMVTDPEVGLLQHLPNEHTAGAQKVPVSVIVNYRLPVPANQPALLPCEGAFVFPNSAPSIMKDVYGVPGLLGPVVFLGQGQNIDMAYEGDTVYHEFGHLINRSLAPFPYYVADQYGVSHLPRALNEGLANTWAFLASERSDLFVYSNYFLTGRNSAMFSGENQAIYPQDFTGWHPVADGDAVLGANWQAYRWLVGNAGFNQSDFVRLLLTTLTQLETTSGRFDFGHYNDAFLNALSELGYLDHIDAIAAVFDSKGLTNPERAIDIRDYDGGLMHRLAIGSTTDWNPDNVVLNVDRDGSIRRASTAFAQMRLTIGEGNTTVTLSGELQASDMPWSESGSFDLELLVRHNQAIEFPADQPQIRFDQKVLPELDTRGSRRLVTWSIEQLIPGETYYFQIVNYGPADGEIAALRVAQSL